MNLITDVAVRPNNSGNQLIVSSAPVVGGIVYTSLLMNNGVIQEISSCFSPITESPTHYLALTSAKTDAGVGLTATAGSGSMGISRTAGTSLQLAGEATSDNAVTDVALFEFDLPSTYIAGTDISVVVNAVVTGAGTITAASTTLTLAAYSETNGVEAALTVTGAVEIPKTTAANLAFVVSGTGLVPGQHVAFELSMLVTSGGVNTGFINSISYQA